MIYYLENLLLYSAQFSAIVLAAACFAHFLHKAYPPARLFPWQLPLPPALPPPPPLVNGPRPFLWQRENINIQSSSFLPFC